MTGKIVKGIAGFYYVHDGQQKVYECRAKGVFRNRKIKPLVGDNVEFEILDEEAGTGSIVSILERKNSLIRPAVSNIDQALVVFASRCIDGWWQGGQAAPPPSGRMHDLSDGMAIIGPRSQATKLDPPVDTENVQLRTDDGQATLTMMPDYTIETKNPQASVTLTPAGAITLEAAAQVTIKAPQITLEGNVTTTGAGGDAGTVQMKGTIALEGSLTSTGDQVAEGKSTAHHTHQGDSGGTTGEPA